jgi:hypothetical protein
MTYKTIEVDIELSDFDDDELIDELESRGKYSPTMGDSDELIDKIFHLRRQGKPYERELDEYLYIKTGRAI